MEPTHAIWNGTGPRKSVFRARSGDPDAAIPEKQKSPGAPLPGLFPNTFHTTGKEYLMTMELETPLCPDHALEIAVESAISSDVAASRGYKTLYGTERDRDELRDLGFTSNIYGRDDAYPALLIPMYRATGEVIGHQVKPAVPRMRVNGEGRPKPVKYETPKGSQAHVDVPAFTRQFLGDLSVPLWITEGIKKTDALVSQGRAAIGLTGVFNWRRKLGTLGDWEDIPLKGRDVVICFDADAKDNRNVLLAMKRLGAWLDSKGARTVLYLIVPSEISGTEVKGVDDFFAAGGSVEALRDAAVKSLRVDSPKDASMTDAMLTDTVCDEELDGRYVWASGIGWLAWNGYVWDEVSETRPTETVRKWVIKKFQNVLSEQSTDPTRDLETQINDWRQIMSRGRIAALVSLSKGNLERDANDFDADPDLMCVRNGYVDLRTGKLFDPDPDKLMTKSAGAEYDPEAAHEGWERALEAVPEELRGWYQDRVGQAATGYMTPDDTLVIAHGEGSNGKSTVVSSVQTVLGSYAKMISDRVLMASPDAHPTELMDLRGARYAVLEETPEARRLDVHRLRKTIGTEHITARKIRQDDVTFKATHSLFVNTNFRPVVTETDHGTWRRLALMSWPYTFRKPHEEIRNEFDRVGDPTLRLAPNDPLFRKAVLAWVIRGAVAWYGRGKVMLPPPKRVVDDTHAWRADTDLITGFAADMLRFTPDGRTLAKEMLSTFNGWMDDQGHKHWTEKTFSSRFGAHDIVKAHKVEKKRVRPAGKSSHPVVTWLGVTLGDDEGGSDPFSEPDKPAGTWTPENEGDSDKTKGVQGVHSVPVTSLAYRESQINWEDCTPCTPLEQSSSELRRKKTDILGSPANRTSDKIEGERKQEIMSSQPSEPSGTAVLDTQSDADPVGIDLETGGANGLFRSAVGSYVKLVGHGDRVDTSPEALIARVRAGATVVGHNLLGFDMLALERHHGLRIEESYGRVRDTSLQAMLADPPTSFETEKGPGFKSYSLDAVAQRVLGKEKDSRGKALVSEYCTVPRCSHRGGACDGWDSIPADDPRYVQYCGEDVRLTEELHRALPWTPYMRREMKVQAIMARMTLNGFRIDEGLLARRIAEGEERKAAALRELETRYGLPTGSKSPLATKAGKEWLSGVYERFGVPNPPRTPKGGLATGSEALKAISEHPRCPAELAVIIGLMGTVTSSRTIYSTISEHVINGRVHPDIWPRQASGRWSVTKPGLTVVGKRGKLSVEREVFLPEPGERIIAVDLGQADMRIVAAHAQDPAYIELFGPGRDVHSEIAMQVFGSAEGENRFRAKAIGHGAGYGRGARAISEANADISFEVAQQFIDTMRERFPGVADWQGDIRAQGEAGELLDNGFGRPMRVEANRAYTQAPAQVGQGGTRDMMAEGLLTLAERAPELLPMLRTVVHDEVVLSVPEKDAEEISRTVVGCFERDWAPRGASNPVHFVADSTAPGVNWAAAYKG